jgi:hypothetical protein
VESGKWKVESGKWKVESGKWKVESGKWKTKLEARAFDLSRFFSLLTLFFKVRGVIQPLERPDPSGRGFPALEDADARVQDPQCPDA